MLATLHKERIRFTDRDVRRYGEDVNEFRSTWMECHRPVGICADLLAKANLIFTTLLDVDADLQAEMLRERDVACLAELEAVKGEWATVLMNWVEMSDDLLDAAVRLQQLCKGPIPGCETLMNSWKEAAGILTSDDEFFDPEHLAELRARALQEHRAGHTEPMEC